MYTKFNVFVNKVLFVREYINQYHAEPGFILFEDQDKILTKPF